MMGSPHRPASTYLRESLQRHHNSTFGGIRVKQFRQRWPNRHVARLRASTAATPNTPGTRRDRRAWKSSALRHAQRTGPSHRRSTARWSDSSYFCEQVPAPRTYGTPQGASASRRGDYLSAQTNRATSHLASTLRGHIGLDLFHPRLVGPGGVEFELEAVHHIRLDVGGVDVELLVPAT